MKESVFMFFRRGSETDPDEKRCSVCGVKLDQSVDICSFCQRRKKRNMIAHMGCLLIVLVHLLVATGLYFVNRAGDAKAVLEDNLPMLELVGRYVSDFDYRYILIVQKADVAGSVLDSRLWNGTVTFSGPSQAFNGRTLRCRVKNEKLVVQLVSGTETNLVEMFSILDSGVLESRLGTHWPGVFKRIGDKPR